MKGKVPFLVTFLRIAAFCLVVLFLIGICISIFISEPYFHLVIAGVSLLCTLALSASYYVAYFRATTNMRTFKKGLKLERAIWLSIPIVLGLLAATILNVLSFTGDLGDSAKYFNFVFGALLVLVYFIGLPIYMKTTCRYHQPNEWNGLRIVSMISNILPFNIQPPADGSLKCTSKANESSGENK